MAGKLCQTIEPIWRRTFSKLQRKHLTEEGVIVCFLRFNLKLRQSALNNLFFTQGWHPLPHLASHPTTPGEAEECWTLGGRCMMGYAGLPDQTDNFRPNHHKKHCICHTRGHIWGSTHTHNQLLNSKFHLIPLIVNTNKKYLSLSWATMFTCINVFGHEVRPCLVINILTMQSKEAHLCTLAALHGHLSLLSPQCLYTNVRDWLKPCSLTLEQTKAL